MPLNEQEKVQYLANVLYVALIDKSLSTRETAALEEVRKNIGANKGMLRAAQKAVQSGSYTFGKAGSFADQVKNLEDMLFVALMDQDLTEDESRLVNEYSRLIGLNQSQLDQLIVETSHRCDAATHEIECPSCSKWVPAQARFCPSCGQALASVDAASMQVGFEIPKEGYAIEFCESTAGGFATAMELAKATGTMQVARKDKKTWYLVTFPANRFADLVPLASSLAGMRNRRVYLDGQELPWDAVFGFIWCASWRATAYRPIEYCFGKDENRINPWGCKQAQMDWTAGWGWSENWFSFGRWKTSLLRSKHVFIFDKERIRHQLATNLYRYRFCPHLQTRFIEAVMKHFPEQAEVTADGPWMYHYVHEAVPGAIEVPADSFGWNFADGVRPRSYAVLADILKKALDECKTPDVEVTALLFTNQG